MGEKRRGALGDLAHVRNSPGGVMSADGNTESTSMYPVNG